MTKRLIDLGILLLLLGAGFHYLRSRSDPDQPSLIESTIVGLDSTGAEVLLYDPTRAESILVMFFQTSCQACEAQYPDWAALRAEAAAVGLTVVAISTIETERSLPPSLRTLPVYTLRSLTDLQAVLPIYGVPTTALLGSQGEIEFFQRGVLTDRNVDKLTGMIRAQP